MWLYMYYTHMVNGMSCATGRTVIEVKFKKGENSETSCSHWVRSVETDVHS